MGGARRACTLSHVKRHVPRPAQTAEGKGEVPRLKPLPAPTASPAVHPPHPLKRAGRAWHDVQGAAMEGNVDAAGDGSGAATTRQLAGTPTVHRCGRGCHWRQVGRNASASAPSYSPPLSPPYRHHCSRRNGRGTPRKRVHSGRPLLPRPAPFPPDDPSPSRARTHIEAKRQRPPPSPQTHAPGNAYGTVAGRAAATAAS